MTPGLTLCCKNRTPALLNHDLLCKIYLHKRSKTRQGNTVSNLNIYLLSKITINLSNQFCNQFI
jgi:hypothetical protein